jgi:hypothetical protein
MCFPYVSQAQNYGLMQYPVPVQNQATYNGMFSPVNQGNSLRGNHPDTSPGENGPKTLNAMQSTGYLGSPYSPITGVQYPLSFQSNNRLPPGSNSHGQISGSNSTLTASSNSLMASLGTSNSGTQIEG